MEVADVKEVVFAIGGLEDLDLMLASIRQLEDSILWRLLDFGAAAFPHGKPKWRTLTTVSGALLSSKYGAKWLRLRVGLAPTERTSTRSPGDFSG